ncbi:lipoprotein NlpI [Phycisphaerae bacterium RAS1]|nr:lipoprotein NlpI [Phycisphaerae bacterium RAS1]
MRKNLLRRTFTPVALVAGTSACLGVFGCQNAQTVSRPGELPQDAARKSDAAPRLNASTYFAHGHLIERQGDLKGAAEQYRKALEISPKFLSARNRLGMVLNALGQHAEASAEFRHAVADNANQAHLHNNLGFSLLLEGDYEGARAALGRALELNPGFRRARMNHALALAHLGHDEEALAEFLQVVPPADANFNLATMQASKGRYAEAARSLEAALQANPEFEAARLKLREVARLAAETPPPQIAAESDAPAGEADESVQAVPAEESPAEVVAEPSAEMGAVDPASPASPTGATETTEVAEAAARTAAVEPSSETHAEKAPEPLETPVDDTTAVEQAGAASPANDGVAEISTATDVPATEAVAAVAPADEAASALTTATLAQVGAELAANPAPPAIPDPCEGEITDVDDVWADAFVDPYLVEIVDWLAEANVEPDADCGSSDAAAEPARADEEPALALPTVEETFATAGDEYAALEVASYVEEALSDGLVRIREFGFAVGPEFTFVADSEVVGPIPLAQADELDSAVEPAELAADGAAIENPGAGGASEAELHALLADLAAAAMSELSEWWEQLMCEMDERLGSSN